MSSSERNSSNDPPQSSDPPPPRFSLRNFLNNNMPSTTRSETSSNTLIAFYDGSGTDARGRTLADILEWDAHRLEMSHDYIQTLFPLPEESGFNWSASIVNKEVFEAFRCSEELRGALRGSFRRILWFYGFELRENEDGTKDVIQGTNFPRHSQHFNTRMDHNHLRITRIIRSLRVLGLEAEALAFHHALESVQPLRASDRSREYWRRAAERALNIRPDAQVRDEQADDVGPRFLREFVRKTKGAESEDAEGDKDGGPLDH